MLRHFHYMNIVKPNYLQVSMDMELMEKQVNLKKDRISIHKNNKSIEKVHFKPNYEGYYEMHLEDTIFHRKGGPTRTLYRNDDSVQLQEYYENRLFLIHILILL